MRRAGPTDTAVVVGDRLAERALPAGVWACAMAEVKAIDANSITLRASKGWVKNVAVICKSFGESDMGLLHTRRAKHAIFFACCFFSNKIRLASNRKYQISTRTPHG